MSWTFLFYAYYSYFSLFFRRLTMPLRKYLLSSDLRTNYCIYYIRVLANYLNYVITIPFKFQLQLGIISSAFFASKHHKSTDLHQNHLIGFTFAISLARNINKAKKRGRESSLGNKWAVNSLPIKRLYFSQ